MRKALLPLCLLLPLSAQASWFLDNESSRLSFISTKASNISEVHRFLTLHGDVNDQGQASLRIALDSVSTAIPLRDERMRKELFDTSRFAEAKVSAQLELAPITALAPGAQLELRLPLTIDLHGRQHSYDTELLVTRLDDKRFQIVTLAPLVLQAEHFDLASGIEALRKIAGLDSISLSVPASTVLIFTSH